MKFVWAIVMIVGPAAIGQEPTTPQAVASAVAAHLQAMPVEDQPFTRYLSLHNLPAKELGDWKALLEWWGMQLTFSPRVVRLAEVPGSKGRVLALDLREYRWNRSAWLAVASREPYFSAPAVGQEIAHDLRTMTAQEIPANVLKANRFPVLAVIRADWFLRDTMESERSPSYYDLLYAGQRFIEKKTTRIVNHPGGIFRYADGSTVRAEAGRYEVEDSHGAEFVDFPKTEDDWNKVHGIKATDDFLKEAKFRLDSGAISPGRHDDPNGSIVANANRVLTFQPIPHGVALKSFDTDKTAGDFDFLEKSPDAVQGKIKFKAGELLVTLPGGGQAAMLINADRKRVELADTRIAFNSLDSRFRDVRTPMGCVLCHAPDSGIIAPRNLVEEIGKAGIEAKIKSKQQSIEYTDFFYGLGKKLKRWQAPHADLAEEIRPKLTGAWAAMKLHEYRDIYDLPINAKGAANEIGVPLEQLLLAVVKSPKVRAQELVQNRSVPRSVWEAELYQEISGLLAVK